MPHILTGCCVSSWDCITQGKVIHSICHGEQEKGLHSTEPSSQIGVGGGLTQDLIGHRCPYLSSVPFSIFLCYKDKLLFYSLKFLLQKKKQC